ncbi:MAG: AMP-binding protein [Phycisphaerae bacterium]|nr:AMP-binding protein [Phycisphaerae bacterium]
MANSSFNWPERPDAPFLWSDRLRLTQGAVARHASALAESIPDKKRVLIRTRPDLHGIAPIIACWLRGATAVLTDPRESEEETSRIATRLNAAVWTPGPPLSISIADPSPLRLDPDAEAVAIRTSGSSGEPKFAVHRLGSLLANAEASNRRVPFSQEDCWLLSLSPHHVGGLGIVIRAMVASACVHVGQGPGDLAVDLREHRWITHVSVVATQLRRLLDDPSLDRRIIALRALLLGGGPTPARWRDEALDRGWPLYVTYGLTECASQVTTSLAMRGDDATDAGVPLDGVRVRCDEVGEIHVAGPTLFAGYLESGATSPAAPTECATGDLGRFDERGRLQVLGRRDAMFVSGGENIRPEEIENALRTIPGVSNACVVAVEDSIWVRRPVAFVAGAFDPANVEPVLAALPRYKWPDRIMAMPFEEAARAKPRRFALAAHVDLPPLWTKR